MDESPSLAESSQPLASTLLSHPGSYVLALESLPAAYAAWASSPSHNIDLIDKTSLRLIQTLSGHDVATTSLRAVDNVIGMPARTLISTGKDGSVKIWDHRSGSHSIKRMSFQSRANRAPHFFYSPVTNLGNTSLGLLSCDASPTGDLVAAGTEFHGQDSFIFYWYVPLSALPTIAQQLKRPL
jgi:WD40 repeat protein